jgi:quinoprotein glucose dehydrogenase
VLALDPATGARKWIYKPWFDKNYDGGLTTSRGVTAWSSKGETGHCSDRIFVGTLNAKLIALDAQTGMLCAGFGGGGVVDLTREVEGYTTRGFYAITSPPTVVGDVLVVGSAIQDNVRVNEAAGVVRGYDCRTGKLLWTWDPIPWAVGQKLRTGAANAWSVIAADLERGLIYVPTSSASPDYYGGMRPGDNRDADSVVALEAATGKKVWAFQVVHHNIWDYDVAAEPLLFTFRGTTPAVAVTTKMGMIFVLNRLTGEPLYPVTEKPVPQSDVRGEASWPTQPFQEALPTLAPMVWDGSQKLGETAEDDAVCRKIIAGLRYEGIYTPPSLKGSLLFPSNLGGVNWGGGAFDPQTGILYANTNRFFVTVQLLPRAPGRRAWLVPGRKERIVAAVLVLLGASFLVGRRVGMWLPVAVLTVLALVGLCRHQIRTRLIGLLPVRNMAPVEMHMAEHFGVEALPQTGTRFSLLRKPLLAPSGDSCAPKPWGTVSAVNLNTAQAVWQTPLGTKFRNERTGTLNMGGTAVTAGGLVFTAASEEPLLRAFDSSTGEELWMGALPVPAQATPMTYTYKGKQYIVIAAGGHGLFGTQTGDAVVAYALPGNGPEALADSLE